jgi:hypothetical protein
VIFHFHHGHACGDAAERIDKSSVLRIELT